METKPSEELDPSPPSLEIESFSKNGFQNLVLLTRLSHGLPHKTTDYDYYSSFPGFQFFTAKMRERSFSLIQKLSTGISPLLPRLASNEHNPLPEIEELFDKLVETNDSGLEQVGHLIDILNGVIPPPALIPSPLTAIETDSISHAPSTSSVSTSTVPYSSSLQLPTWNRLQRGQGPTNHWVRGQLLRSNQIPKPQITRLGLDNSDTPFIPALRGGVKPNAVDPVRSVIDHSSLDDLLSRMRAQDSARLHPYYDELQDVNYSQTVFHNSEPDDPGPLDNHTYEFITTEDRIDVLVQKLNEVTEIAIDLEHHDYRSYLGFTCLVQISIKGHDYVIDPLCVGHCLHKLLDPFTNPQIIKVLHGADHDVQWLQRDFGLYLVGMFDTHQSSIVLGLPKKSLAFLLNYCCNVTASKKFQIADWRLRPLPPQMERYAREDTHYLLYIYHRMRNELIRRSTKDLCLLTEVLDKSRMICLKVYTKPIFDPQGYLRLLSKNARSINPFQREIAKRLYAWRNLTAREKDESFEYVLPSSMLFQISDKIPTGKQGILACCDPIPPLMSSSLDELVMILQEAKTYCTQNPNFEMLPVKRRKSERLNSTPISSLVNTSCPDVLEVTVDQNNDPNHFTPAKDYMTIPEGKASLSILAECPSQGEEDVKALINKVLASFTDPFDLFLMRPADSTEPTAKHDLQGAISLPLEDGILEQDIIYLAPDKDKPKAYNPLVFTTIKPDKSDVTEPIEVINNSNELVLDEVTVPKDFIVIGDMMRKEMKNQPTQNGEYKKSKRGRKRKHFREPGQTIQTQIRPFKSFNYSAMPPPPVIHPMPPPKRMRFQNPFPRHPMPPVPPPFIVPGSRNMYPPPIRPFRLYDRGFSVFNRYPPPQHFVRHQGVPWPS
ncbi:Exosome component 10 [Oopsacas minuta]|uniref:Exosome component 10 n=1 Tax=Oopsacas minuta TaxID=111878 RepID=A0AAV7K5K1_9METZ|nr:Exosome component 10 [Oopsacas minuta]